MPPRVLASGPKPCGGNKSTSRPKLKLIPFQTLRKGEEVTLILLTRAQCYAAQLYHRIFITGGGGNLNANVCSIGQIREF